MSGGSASNHEAPSGESTEKPTEDAPNETSPFALFERIKEIGALSVVLYVFGFLVFRARLKVLGVEANLPVADERYLSEGGAFLAETAEAIFPWGFLLLVMGGLGWGISRWAKRSTRLMSWLRQGSRWFSPTLRVLCYVALAAVLSKLMQVYFGKVVVAKHVLLSDVGGQAKAWLLSSEAGDKLYTKLVAIVLGSVACYWLFRGGKSRKPAPRILQVYVAALLVLELLLLPINYAVLEWDARYPVVTVHTEAPEPELADRVFLLLQTEKEVSVFTGQKLLTLDRESVKSLETHCFANVLKNEACPAGKP